MGKREREGAVRDIGEVEGLMTGWEGSRRRQFGLDLMNCGTGQIKDDDEEEEEEEEPAT